jgi:hypothetical protein
MAGDLQISGAGYACVESAGPSCHPRWTRLSTGIRTEPAPVLHRQPLMSAVPCGLVDCVGQALQLALVVPVPPYVLAAHLLTRHKRQLQAFGRSNAAYGLQGPPPGPHCPSGQ